MLPFPGRCNFCFHQAAKFYLFLFIYFFEDILKIHFFLVLEVFFLLRGFLLHFLRMFFAKSWAHFWISQQHQNRDSGDGLIVGDCQDVKIQERIVEHPQIHQVEKVGAIDARVLKGFGGCPRGGNWGTLKGFRLGRLGNLRETPPLVCQT